MLDWISIVFICKGRVINKVRTTVAMTAATATTAATAIAAAATTAATYSIVGSMEDQAVMALRMGACASAWIIGI